MGWGKYWKEVIGELGQRKGLDFIIGGFDGGVRLRGRSHQEKNRKVWGQVWGWVDRQGEHSWENEKYTEQDWNGERKKPEHRESLPIFLIAHKGYKDP